VTNKERKRKREKEGEGEGENKSVLTFFTVNQLMTSYGELGNYVQPYVSVINIVYSKCTL
jgi:hypothetical protein